MPELPEVETIRRELDAVVPGRLIVSSWAHGSEKFAPAQEAVGAGIDAVRRRGKYLLVDLDDERELVIHLGMTGQLSVIAPEDQSERDEYVRAEWTFSDESRLRYRDVRRFGRIRVVDAGDYTTITTLARLGPEPFDDEFTATHLHQALSKSSRRLKTQLLSQRPVAGVGNIYADEALWQAQVHPAARRISKPASVRLHEAIRDVLRLGIDNGGTTLRDYRTVEGAAGQNQYHLRCYGRAGEPCERCAAPLSSKVWDGRTTTWCRECQRR